MSQDAFLASNTGLIWLQLLIPWYLSLCIVPKNNSNTLKAIWLKVFAFGIVVAWWWTLGWGWWCVLFPAIQVGTVALVAWLNPIFSHPDLSASKLTTAQSTRYPYAAELEVLATLVGGGATYIGIRTLQLKGALAQVSVPWLSPEHASTCLLVTLALLISGEPATRIVRGVLDKGGTYPHVTNESGRATFTEQTPIVCNSAPTIDSGKYDAGRLIGNLERIIAIGLVLFESYEALGFLLAGKSLSRAKEFESKDFSEYFILGTLTSITIAAVVGFGLKVCLKSMGVL